MAKFIAERWNSERHEYYGFKLEVPLESVEDFCMAAADVFDREPLHFANPPSAYKRIAAFLVMGCLEPFWDFVPYGKEGSWGDHHMPRNEQARRRWHVRFLIDALPYIMDKLQIKVGDEWRPIHWNGFPSDHFQLEFMNWMRWLEGLEQVKDRLQDENLWVELHHKRVARMVLATALMIESCCYCSPDPKQWINHRGETKACMAKLTDEDWLDLEFMQIPGN